MTNFKTISEEVKESWLSVPFEFSAGCNQPNSTCEITIPPGAGDIRVEDKVIADHYMTRADPLDRTAGRKLPPPKDGKIRYQTTSMVGDVYFSTTTGIKYPARIFLPPFDKAQYCAYLSKLPLPSKPSDNAYLAPYYEIGESFGRGESPDVFVEGLAYEGRRLTDEIRERLAGFKSTACVEEKP